MKANFLLLRLLGLSLGLAFSLSLGGGRLGAQVPGHPPMPPMPGHEVNANKLRDNMRKAEDQRLRPVERFFRNASWPVVILFILLLLVGAGLGGEWKEAWEKGRKVHLGWYVGAGVVGIALMALLFWDDDRVSWPVVILVLPLFLVASYLLSLINARHEESPQREPLPEPLPPLPTPRPPAHPDDPSVEHLRRMGFTFTIDKNGNTVWHRTNEPPPFSR